MREDPQEEGNSLRNRDLVRTAEMTDGKEGDKPFAEPSKDEMPEGYWRTRVGCRIYSRTEISRCADEIKTQ